MSLKNGKLQLEAFECLKARLTASVQSESDGVGRHLERSWKESASFWPRRGREARLSGDFPKEVYLKSRCPVRGGL